ncbi:MAG: leucyl/phenylalanyl-tRNA--protein transferase [Proteobacteria bacterium]|nr:leucyl/phenylalanyl-tRNA--protein transferase [Pseudomonadota bacterium]MBU1709061.1 leucyl/phenylalanyl-tRNA--protein transferase [Pseudomonadota bacterium]
MPVFQLTDSPFFPPPHLAREDGLIAVGGDLSPERILVAYQMGIFPWYSQGEPILWWAPDPRLVLFPDELRISKRLARTIRKKPFRITMDSAFRQVIESCAKFPRPGQEEAGTWIVEEMIEAYCTLHDLGFAHSVECWDGDELVGGLYGLAIGAIYYGESMFSKASDASKIGMAFLVEKLAGWGFEMIDCQIATDHLKRMGAREIPADDFYDRLNIALSKPTRQGKWG